MDFASPTFEKMFRKRGGFDVVANFSAHKHVRSEKDIFSVEALLQNNVLHAKILLDLLEEFPPEEYFCVSTDKAANPVNIIDVYKRQDYNIDTFKDNGINHDLKEVFYTISKKGVIRAIHFQLIKQQAKLVRCISGHVYDLSLIHI